MAVALSVSLALSCSSLHFALRPELISLVLEHFLGVTVFVLFALSLSPCEFSRATHEVLLPLVAEGFLVSQ